MSSPCDDIAFLANSENRIRVLESLRDGSHSRHVLMETTDVSRVTLGRILDEFKERRWITQRGQVAEITPLGDWVIDEFLELAETIEGERRLRTVYQWFPTNDYGFHISCLADADITLVRRADASAPITELTRQFEIGGAVYAFSFAITSQFLEACWQRVTDSSVTWRWVFTPEVLEVLKTNREMADQSREMLESGRAEYRLFEGEIPHVVIVSEKTVNLRLADEDGAATALIQSDHPDVRAWADSTFERYWREGSMVDADLFTPRSANTA